MLNIEGVTKAFTDQLVLSEIHFSIESGSIFGLIGPNGAGKSTLLKILAGIMKADTGHVLLDEKEIYDQPELKKDIILLSDEPFYFLNATIHEMKEFYKAWYSSFDEESYQRYIHAFQLNDKIEMKNFSKGMKRQAFIAIALAICPKYLLLDEAFDGLDPLMRLTFKQAIAQRLEEKEMTVIISSHNLRELEDICDHYGILENCQMNTKGNIEEDRSQIHKIQLAFSKELREEDFAPLNTLSITITSRVVTLVVKGDLDNVNQFLESLHPLLKEVLNISLEELFLYEMKQKGYGVYEK